MCDGTELPHVNVELEIESPKGDVFCVMSQTIWDLFNRENFDGLHLPEYFSDVIVTTTDTPTLIF